MFKKVIVFVLIMILGSVFFTQTASAQVASCTPPQAVVFDISGNMYCIDLTGLTPTASANWMTIFQVGQNSTTGIVTPTGFSLDNIITAQTYREALFVKSLDMHHEATAIAFINASFYSTDVPNAFNATLTQGQSLLCWNTQRLDIVIYHNPTANAATFQTIIADACRGFESNEFDEDLFRYWFDQMLRAEWNRLPLFFEIVLVN